MKKCHHQHCWPLLLAWYFALGALHEVSHVVSAVLTGRNGGILHDGIPSVLVRLILLRQCTLPGLTNDLAGDFVRHSGWITSVALAVCLRHNKNASLAALLVALEALSTDLLGLVPSTPSQNILFCGNFGIILLHSAWSSNGGTSALDILEKMVQVTMMRGAQSGGVVTFQPTASGSMQGIRSRVVNRKRTDLSKEVRKKIVRDVALRKGSIPFFSGHTRFATSSKATFEGTHPQRWTPPSHRRVYDFNVPHTGNHTFAPSSVKVENYITHNGDFDFYSLNGTTYDLEVIQQFLSIVTGPMPAVVDSCAVAGIVDLLRTQGCFGLSARYVICLGLPSSTMQANHAFPSYAHFEQIGLSFESVLGAILKTTELKTIGEESRLRHSFALRVLTKLEKEYDTLVLPLSRYITDDEGGASLFTFCLETINAFFDNDLFFTTQTFLRNAKGSFGLCVTSSLDANRQIVLAARGQTMSIAFYPNKGLICYGSEQAAVKAALNVNFPGINADVLGRSQGDVDNDALRLDLDDLNGEVIVLDWGQAKYKNPPVSPPNRCLAPHELMNGALTAIIFHESKATTDNPQLYHRMTPLTRNRLIKPLRPETKDLVLSDIQDIPKVCRAIQEEWKVDQAASSLNRLTAFNLSRCLRERLEAHVKGTVHPRAIDIMLTGCEVSLWLAEQFAGDLQKAFPNLRIKAISSNKLLGLYGQEIAVPSLGFPDAPKTHHLHDTIIIIVSHSGGTFAPLSCSNLLQSTTPNLFVVTSEWDTQIGKQLRAMDRDEEEHLFNSRIFTTDVGMRPAEPCSVSVAATHQLLTNLFEYICAFILSDSRFRRATAATISEQDLQVLEKCNINNIDALCEIISVNTSGESLESGVSNTAAHLRAAGDLWAQHILENTKAYIMTFFYIFGTVISGYPLVYGISAASGFNRSSNWLYLIRLLDAAIYFWMPQINIVVLRLLECRNLRHRMVGRTVAIGDIPWVAQAAEAFLSKIFACSYSIAGLNVLSGNPADHFVHRHTHRVVRGTLVVCGRPDGRLSALSTAEAAVCLSVNQASSIQSWGGTCESVTIGHNPFRLALSHNAIFLKRKRPHFLCERLLVETDIKQERDAATDTLHSTPDSMDKTDRPWLNPLTIFSRRRHGEMVLESSTHHGIQPRVYRKRSAAALIGAYMNFEEDSERKHASEEAQEDTDLTVESVVNEAIKEKKWSDHARKLFTALDLDGNGFLSFEEFMESSYRLNSILSDEELAAVFKLVDADGSGQLDYDEFLEMLKVSDIQMGIKLPPSNRNDKGLIQIEASREKYFGETLRKYNAGKTKNDVDFMLARSQHFSQELYETRIASLQRFVAMTVMFHQMGKRVQEFFVHISFGLLGYRMDRTHSIMRIATTASPVSGADVRQRMRHLQLLKKIQHSIYVIATAYLRYKARKNARRLSHLERQSREPKLS